MRVRIIRGNFWYAFEEGKIFIVSDEDLTRYFTTIDGEKRGINKQDCAIISEGTVSSIYTKPIEEKKQIRCKKIKYSDKCNYNNVSLAGSTYCKLECCYFKGINERGDNLYVICSHPDNFKDKL